MSGSMAISAKRGLGFVAVVALVASALVGGNAFSLRDRLLGSAIPAPRAVAVSPFVHVGSSAKPQQSVLRSQPWWQGVSVLKGGAGTTPSDLVINQSAIQWRARWGCSGGTLVVRMARRRSPLIDARCPAAGTVSATRGGRIGLMVMASGTWSVKVDQQVDVPLFERALPAMSSPGSSAVAVGVFQRVDQYVTGRVTVYHLANDRYAIRFDHFYVTPNVDLEVRLSPLRSVRSTRQYLSAPSALIAPLNVTAGSLNFLVPAGVNPAAYRSVVIWCPLITSAYAAASLRSAA